MSPQKQDLSLAPLVPLELVISEWGQKDSVGTNAHEIRVAHMAWGQLSHMDSTKCNQALNFSSLFFFLLHGAEERLNCSANH